MMSKIGLVTVLYNSDSVIEEFINSIGRQKYNNYKLYLVDNSVNEKTTHLLESYLQEFPNIEFEHIKNTSNEGVAKGNNIGIKKALEDQCDCVTLLNNDIVFENENLFEELINLANKEKDVIIAPKIYYHGTSLIWYAGGYHHNILTLGIHHSMKAQDNPQQNTSYYCTYAPTCFVLIPKKIFETIGFMHEDYFAYYDDNDFMYRAVKNDFKILYTPSVCLCHKVSTSTGGDDSLFYIFYANRNKIIFIKRNYPFVRQMFSIAVLFAGRIKNVFKYNSNQRKAMLKGLKEGLFYKSL
jgi:GT2 family glycosyltransferase